VVYRGSISESPTSLDSDRHHSIEARKVFPVCGNTYRMLDSSKRASPRTLSSSVHSIATKACLMAAAVRYRLIALLQPILQ